MSRILNRILLVEPDFPYPKKSKNKASKIHRNFVPVGLLKIGAFFKEHGKQVKLVRGNIEKKKIEFIPSHIFITSIFTYWSQYVWDTVSYYRCLYPKAVITIGGIYATLHHRKKAFRENLKKYKAICHIGLYQEAEKSFPDYSLLNDEIGHHVTHAMRGCIRRCSFCGTWRIEPRRYDKPVEELVNEIKAIGKTKVIFFDNNFFAHNDIQNLLEQLANIRIKGRRISYESQSGFDGRLLQKKPWLAKMLKSANFKNVRIAWDNSSRGHKSIKKQIDILVSAGYKPESIAIFMIYNYDLSYEEMLKKIKRCHEWGVQINDCRYRPLNAEHDYYNPRKYTKGQTAKDYYIHVKADWTDQRIRAFRRLVRQHNIWVRYAKGKGGKYNKDMERWSDIHNTFKFYGLDRPPDYERIQNSPTWTRRVHLMKKLRNYLRKYKKIKISLSGLKKSVLDQLLIETCQMLGIQID